MIHGLCAGVTRNGCVSCKHYCRSVSHAAVCRMSLTACCVPCKRTHMQYSGKSHYQNELVHKPWDENILHVNVTKPIIIQFSALCKLFFLSIWTKFYCFASSCILCHLSKSVLPELTTRDGEHCWLSLSQGCPAFCVYSCKVKSQVLGLCQMWGNMLKWSHLSFAAIIEEICRLFQSPCTAPAAGICLMFKADRWDGQRLLKKTVEIFTDRVSPQFIIGSCWGCILASLCSPCMPCPLWGLLCFLGNMVSH